MASLMNVQQVMDYCSQCKGATANTLGHPHNVLAYSIGDKKFAYFKTSDPEKWRFSVRVTPEQFIELTDRTNIKPARYMGRFHWITIVDVARLDGIFLQQLINSSHAKTLFSLSKKRQIALLD